MFLSFCELTSRAGEVVNLTNLILQQPRANGFIIPGTNEDIPENIKRFRFMHLETNLIKSTRVILTFQIEKSSLEDAWKME